MEQLQSHIWLTASSVWLSICAFPHILGSPSSYITCQLLRSELPYMWGNFFFISPAPRWLFIFPNCTWLCCWWLTAVVWGQPITSITTESPYLLTSRKLLLIHPHSTHAIFQTKYAEFHKHYAHSRPYTLQKNWKRARKHSSVHNYFFE